MPLKNFLQKIKVAKVAVALLIVYAVSLTAVVVLAAFVGPLKEELNLMVKNRTLEADLRASAETSRGLRAERDRLLMAVKNSQNDLDVSRTTNKALRRSVDEGSVERDLAKANEMVDKLNRERAVLAGKLDSLQKELQNIGNSRVPADSKKVALETSDLVVALEKEKTDLRNKVRELEERLKNK